MHIKSNFLILNSMFTSFHLGSLKHDLQFVALCWRALWRCLINVIDINFFSEDWLKWANVYLCDMPLRINHIEYVNVCFRSKFSFVIWKTNPAKKRRQENYLVWWLAKSDYIWVPQKTLFHRNLCNRKVCEAIKMAHMLLQQCWKWYNLKWHKYDCHWFFVR